MLEFFAQPLRALGEMDITEASEASGAGSIPAGRTLFAGLLMAASLLILPPPARAQSDFAWSSPLSGFQVVPVFMHKKKLKPAKNRHTGTAHIDVDSIVIFGDGLLSFSAVTHNYPVGSLIHVALESGTVLESNGGFSNPNFQLWRSESAKVLPDQTAHFKLPLTNMRGGYLRIRLPWHEMPGAKSPILTFSIGGPIEVCGRPTQNHEPCRVLFGYGGAGQR